MRWTRWCFRRTPRRVRSSRVVLSPRRWGQARGRFHGRRWLTSPRHRGEHGAAVQTIARGMPSGFGVPVVTTLVCFFHSQARLWVRHAPGIPCALSSRRDEVVAKPGRKPPRECCLMSFGCHRSQSGRSIIPEAFRSEPVCLWNTGCPAFAGHDTKGCRRGRVSE